MQQLIVTIRAMKIIILFLNLFFAVQAICQDQSFYRFEVKTADGNLFNFARLKGKKVLIVNTASECTLAPQLRKLQELYAKYGGDNFEIIAFPSNDFGGHEPGDNQEINRFYKNEYGITFPVMEKISIKGENQHPVYKWLLSHNKKRKKVLWNYQKFMIDENGKVAGVVSPIGSPVKKRIRKWLE